MHNYNMDACVSFCAIINWLFYLQFRGNVKFKLVVCDMRLHCHYSSRLLLHFIKYFVPLLNNATKFQLYIKLSYVLHYRVRYFFH